MRFHRRTSGFTLIELVLSMIVFSIIASVITPVIMSATESYAAARTLRGQTEGAAFAVERVVRVLREAPGGDTTRLGVVTATSQELEFTDGSGVRLVGSDLEVLVAGEGTPVAREVESFELLYIESDGAAVPELNADAHRIHVEITVSGFSLSTIVFPRVNAGGG